MERLTYDSAIGGEHCWEVRGADNLLCEEVCKNQGNKGCEDCPIRKAIDRLAAYENTDLTPEEVERMKEYMQPFTIQDMDRFREIMRAEADGRLVILPCKITDTVYTTEAVYERGKWKKPVGEQVVSAQIDRVTIGGTTGKPVYDLCTETGGWYYSMEPGDFYMTRESAEEALKGQEG